ncbi:MAG TPA: hypothetical protein PK425_07960 [Syntrophales bacterium]|nr:hypothetical protein [Syntrophales bacterium]
MILFVFAYHHDREVDRFQFILDHWAQLLNLEHPFQFLFVKSTDRDLRTPFKHLLLEHKDPLNLKRSQCVSQEWAMVAQLIENTVECDYWFWWEYDVLPVKKDCFDFFIRKWTPSCRIMGYRVRDNKWGMKHRINGVALYARDYWSYIKSYFNLLGTFDTRKAFHNDENDLFVETNDWYSLVHHEERLFLTPSLRLVHGIRDDSLIKQILTGTGPYPMVSELNRKIRNKLTVLKHEYRGYKRYPPET